MIRTYTVIICCLLLSSALFGFGEPPTFDDDPQARNNPAVTETDDSSRYETLDVASEPEPALQPEVAADAAPAVEKKRSGFNPLGLFNRPKKEGQPTESEPTPAAAPTPTAPSVQQQTPSVASLAEKTGEVLDLEDAYFDAIRERKYKAALTIIQQFPPQYMSDKKQREKRKLELFDLIEREKEKEGADFFKTEDLDLATQRTIKRLYREAQRAYFTNEMDLGKNLLIHTLHLHRRNFKARKFLELGWDLRPGMYKVEDMENKYWRKSSISFYGGQYMESVKALTVLTHINNQNALVYERLGSSYYNTGETQKAIDAWKTSQFLDPSNRDLSKIIKKAEQVLKEEKRLAMERQKKTSSKKKTVTQEQTQLMGVFRTSTEAYSFAAELKKQGKEPLVEENDQGRWAVRIIKSSGAK